MAESQSPENPPIFNLPFIVTLTMAILFVCHLIHLYLAGGPYEEDFILLFAAIPGRYTELGAILPYPSAAWYTPVTYAFLHGDWTHLIFNLAWLMAFGAPVAKRLGNAGYLFLFLAGSLVAFGFHLASHMGEFRPLIGASGAVSAYMGAAIRLPRIESSPILSLPRSLENRGLVGFIVIWFLFNLVAGLYPQLVGVENAEIAWQAHIGGFLTGLLSIRILDQLKRH